MATKKAIVHKPKKKGGDSKSKPLPKESKK